MKLEIVGHNRTKIIIAYKQHT